MNASDARQVICRRKRERRSLEQSSYQALSERMKKHVKRISNEESTQSLRDANEKYHVKENEIAQRLDQIEKLFRYSYENETYKTDRLFLLSSCIHRANIELFLRTFKTNVTTHSTLLQRLIRESSTHAARRRNDEHEQTSEYREEFKSLDHLIDENQFINSIFTD
jgi:predicted glycoside hydrolase/deacetylase ChbG (UPF0249 family)